MGGLRSRFRHDYDTLYIINPGAQLQKSPAKLEMDANPSEPAGLDEPILCMYSGGADSTLAAAIAAQRTSRVFLLTLGRFGVFQPRRAAHNAAYLKRHFPEAVFNHLFDDFELEYKRLAYGKEFRCAPTQDLRNASMCGLCKLGMHWKTIRICLARGIKTVFDGSVKSSRIFPEQNRVIMLEELEKLYWKNGIQYENPVFELNTQEQLFKMGVMPSARIKGTAGDIQPLCSQQLLFAQYAELCLARGTVEEYELKLSEFYTEKIRLLGEELAARTREGACR